MQNMNILIKPKVHHKKSQVFDSIYSKEEFLEVVRRERLRTHRNKVPFSLLIFGMVTNSGDRQVFEDLIRVMLPRVRATDEVGWYSDHKIGILLPETAPEGAELVANEILVKVGVDKGLAYEIQSYPKEIRAGVMLNTGLSQEDVVGKSSPNDEEKYAGIESSEIDEIFAPPMPAWKRGLDILGAGVGLVVLFPVFLFIGAFIKIVSPGPIFFKQVRVGFREKQFICWKFRTMKVESDTTVHKKYLQTLIKNENESMKKLDEDDPRIIPCGKILRKTGLDELPQLLNILLGDMSLVGPRPCTVYEASEYRIWQHRRFDTKPGLTGLWQVSGKNRTSFVEMMRLDIGYAISKSFLKDLWILIKTFPAVFRQVFDRFPKMKKKERCYEESCKYRHSWMRILGSKSHSKF
jgi:lipopolysaccharide/colanic/teichoic acid biosynthesis glycosyltransferase